MTGKKHWELSQAEADNIGSATDKVLSHFDIPGIDQKTVDVCNLAYALGIVYVPRIFVTASEAKADAPRQAAAPIVTPAVQVPPNKVFGVGDGNLAPLTQ